MQRLAAVLLAALMLVGNLQLPAGAASEPLTMQSVSEPPQPADDTVLLPAPATAAPWWERTSRDSDRNGIVDWLEEQTEPTAVVFPIATNLASASWRRCCWRVSSRACCSLTQYYWEA